MSTFLAYWPVGIVFVVAFVLGAWRNERKWRASLPVILPGMQCWVEALGFVTIRSVGMSVEYRVPGGLSYHSVAYRDFVRRVSLPPKDGRPVLLGDLFRLENGSTVKVVRLASSAKGEVEVVDVADPRTATYGSLYASPMSLRQLAAHATRVEGAAP